MTRLVVGFLLATTLAGCYKWATPPGTVDQALSAGRLPDRVRVTMADSTTVVLHRPAVSGDTLIGRTSLREVQPRHIPRHLIIHLEQREEAVVRGVLVILLLTTLALLSAAPPMG